MSARSNLRTAQTLTATLARIGGIAPKAMTTDLETLTRLAKEVDRLDVADRFGASVLDALAAGRDLETDPAVRQAAVRRQLMAGLPSVRHELATRSERLLFDHADAVLVAYAKPFDKAAAVLAAAAQTLGAIDLDDSRAVLAKGPDAAAAWARAQQAVDVITQARQAWETLYQVTHSSTIDSRFACLVYADIPPATWFDDGLAAQHPSDRPTPWECVVAGYPLALATPEVHEQRRAAIYAEGARRDAARANATDYARGAQLRHI